MAVARAVNRTALRHGVRWATVAVHIIIAAALALMTLPSFGTIADQLRSGYIPPRYWLYPVLVLIAISLAAAVMVGLVRWLHESRRTLVAVDIAVVTASWTILVVFVFSNVLPIVPWALSPVALILAWLAPTKITTDPAPTQGTVETE
jgi:hypothetical protein